LGKSPKPLSFLVHSSLYASDAGRAALHALEAQGHTIAWGGALLSTENEWYDIILGPNCWRAFDLKYLDLAIKSARSVKYAKTKESVIIKAKSKGKKSTVRRRANNELDATELRTDSAGDEGDLMAGSSGSRE